MHTQLGRRAWGMVTGLRGLQTGGGFWYLFTGGQVLLRTATLVSGRGWMCGEQGLGFGVP